MENEIIIKLQKFVNDYFFKKDSIQVLDAGCGSLTRLKFKEGTHITGIDILEKPLQRNINLDKKILGNIEKYQFKNLNYDIVICWDVLECLKKPIVALNNLLNTIHDGILILKLPNFYSIKGIISKFTPYFFHQLVFKYLIKNRRSAGVFKTPFKLSVSPHALRRYASRNRLDIIFVSFYDCGDDPTFLNNDILNALYKKVKKLVNYLSFRKIGDSEFVMVFKKL